MGQLLKFIPTKEEIETLNQYAAEVDRMGIADRFFFEIAQIPRYEEKLKAIHYRKTFEERLQLSIDQVDAIQRASTELYESKAVSRLFEVILALGNYMNKGARGNSPGFKLSSLSKLKDTKSTDGKQNLLNYIVYHMDKKYKNPSIPELQDQTKSIKTAKSIDMKDLRSEMKKLQSGLELANKEVEASKIEQTEVPTLTSFCFAANIELEKFTQKWTQMDEKLKKTAKHFGENPGTVDSHELFSTFDNFFNSLEFAKEENKKREEEEREKEKQKIILKERKERIASASKKKNFDEMGEMLRKGDLFAPP